MAENTVKAVAKVKAKTTKSGSSKTAKKKLVIVESPSKAKTIGKYLGSTYKVIASVGHVRDLPASKLGVNIEDDFDPEYISIRGKGPVIKELRTEAKKASKVYLATDPDREGEAISWHLAYLLNIDPSSECRVAFNEITKDTIKEAIKHPRAIDLKLVDAQQARRVLDRLVGYQISPLLWRKVRRGLSAGRVQSAALKILCDREKEIRDFVAEEYWTIDALFNKGKDFTARLAKRDGKDYRPENEEEKNAVLSELKGEAGSTLAEKEYPAGKYVVAGVTEKEIHPRAYAPYTTSTMQQEASNKLNFTTKKTMQVAQQLYEGVDIKGRGTLGLITYLRTDSVRISDAARAAAREFIEERYGKQYVGNNFYSNKKKEIQDAHEAIRPTNIDIVPDEVKSMLTTDQYKLYKLVWNRFVASQMSPATVKSVGAEIRNGRYGFDAKGSIVLFDGYQKVYKNKNDEKNTLIPDLEKGETLEPIEVTAEQNFTKPPSRYTEASLVKELEEKNIGRPSTYAPIVSTLSERRYVKKEKKSLVPTDLGFTVNDIMTEYFTDIVNVQFTSDMEDRLDDIESKGIKWKKVIEDFYGPFEKELKKAEDAIEKVVVEDRPTGEMCEICGRPMVYKMGRFGEFIACSGYPECKNTRPIVKSTGVKCPECGKEIVERRSKRGKIFYGCSGFPTCKVSFWYRPVNKTCPKCGSLLLERKGRGTTLVCSNEECDYKE